VGRPYVRKDARHQSEGPRMDMLFERVRAPGSRRGRGAGSGSGGCRHHVLCVSPGESPQRRIRDRAPSSELRSVPGVVECERLVLVWDSGDNDLSDVSRLPTLSKYIMGFVRANLETGNKINFD
jgi:hypothetical protein